MLRGGRGRTAIGVALVALCSALPLAACGGGNGSSGEHRAAAGTITWLVEQPWGGVYNVYRPEGSSYYLREILAGILPVAGDFTPAGTWRWSTDLFSAPPRLVADAPQTMEFHLRPGAVWSDGKPIGPDDFRFAWYQNSGRADQCTGCDPADTTGWELVDKIDASADARTVTITLRPGAADAEWYAHFGPSAYPAHVAAAHGFDWRTPEGAGKASQWFASTVPTWSGGPYLLKGVVPDERATWVPNPRWYGKVTPSLSRVVLEVVPRAGDVPLAVQNGELDGGAPLAFDSDVLAQLRQDHDVTTSSGSGGGTFDHLELNSAGAALSDVALRRAVLTAIDTKELRTRTFGDLDPTLRDNLFFERSDPRHQDVLAGTGFGSGDVTAARSILRDAGYSGAEPGQALRKGGTKVPPLRFLHGDAKAALAQVVQSELAQLGLTVTLVPTAATDYLRTLSAGGFDLTAFSFGGGPLVVGAPGQVFRSDSKINFTQLQDPEIDGLIDQLRSVVDPAEVADLVNRIARLAQAQATILPLWDNPAYAFVRHGYDHVRDNRYSSVRALDDVQAWALAGAG